MPNTVLITGAAGNLGGLLARRLLRENARLRLMVHRTPLPSDLEQADGVEVIHADLSRAETLPAAVAGVDVIVHFAGVLFSTAAGTFPSRNQHPLVWRPRRCSDQSEGRSDHPRLVSTCGGTDDS